jgi:hypothetical protein
VIESQSRGERLMYRSQSVAVLVLGVLIALVLGGGAARAADIVVNVPELGTAPSAGNDYNCTLVSDQAGQPLGPGDTVSLNSSSQITSVTNGTAAGSEGALGSVGSPSQLSNGTWTVEFKIDHTKGIDVLIVTYKDGKKRCVLVGVGTTGLTWTGRVSGTTLIVSCLGSFGVGQTVPVGGRAQLRNWVPAPLISPNPVAPGANGGE